MPGKYAVPVSDTNTNATTIGYIVGASTCRVHLYEVIISSRATPADNAAGYRIDRFTAENGTPGGTAITPRAIDPAYPAALAGGRSAPTGEPTYTSNSTMLEINGNQRQLIRWICSPRGELIAPATAANGLGLLGVSPTTAFQVEATLLFFE